MSKTCSLAVFLFPAPQPHLAALPSAHQHGPPLTAERSAASTFTRRFDPRNNAVASPTERLTRMRYADSPFGAHHAPVTEPATAFAPAGSAPVTRSACVTRRSNPPSALEKKKRTTKASRHPNGL